MGEEHSEFPFSPVEEEEVTYTVIDQFQQKFGAAVSMALILLNVISLPASQSYFLGLSYAYRTSMLFSWGMTASVLRSIIDLSF